MPNDPFGKLSLSLQQYTLSVSFLGIMSAALAYLVTNFSAALGIVFVIALVVALVLELMPIEEVFPQVLGEVTLSDALHLSAIALFGYGFAVSLGIASCLIAEVVRKRIWYKALFNTATYALTISSAAWAFILASSIAKNTPYELPLSFLTAALFYRITGSLLIGGLITLRQGKHIAASFLEQFIGDWVLFLAQVIIGLSATYLYLGNPLSALIMLVPLLVLSWSSGKARRLGVEAAVREDELSRAEEVLRSFLPTLDRHEHLDIAYRFLPHDKLSGDFFDMRTVDDHLYIAIGDAMGKGVQAAIAGSPTRLALQFWASHFNAAEILEKLNEFLYEKSLPEAFVSMFCARYHLETGELKWSNAGHPPPIACNISTGEVRMLSGDSVMLGAQRNALYREHATSLAEDDVLVLYTDGITETLGSGRRQYGTERLKKVLRQCCHLPSEQIVGTICENLSSFSSGYRHDDLTIVVLKGWQPAK